jgi:hypothetical protein
VDSIRGKLTSTRCDMPETRALVTLSVGQHGEEMLAISGPLLQQYAERIGARFHVFRVAESPYPCGEKFRFRGAVEHYDRTLCIDADVVLDPARCPDIYSEFSGDRLAAHDDGPWIRRNSNFDWIQRETDELCDSQGIERYTVQTAYNSGIVLLSRAHSRFFEQPRFLYPGRHCCEQWWEWINVQRYQIPIQLLPEEWNYQWWFQSRMPSFAERPDVHIRHYAGMQGCRDERLALMREHAREIGTC